MARKSLKTLDEEWTRQATKLGLLDQKHFRQAMEAYNFQVQLAETLRARIAREGTSIWVPAGKDSKKMVSNPAIADLNKAEILAQKIRVELDGKVKEALQAQRTKEQEDELLHDRL